MMNFKSLIVIALIAVTGWVPARGMDTVKKVVVPILASKLFWGAVVAGKVGIHAVVDYKKNNCENKPIHWDAAGNPDGFTRSTKPWRTCVEGAAFSSKSTYALVGIGGLVWWIASKYNSQG